MAAYPRNRSDRARQLGLPLRRFAESFGTLFCLCGLLCALTGCSLLEKFGGGASKVSNPVVGPPPVSRTENMFPDDLNDREKSAGNASVADKADQNTGEDVTFPEKPASFAGELEAATPGQKVIKDGHVEPINFAVNRDGDANWKSKTASLTKDIPIKISGKSGSATISESEVAEVAATVFGVPIFMDDVLAPFAAGLAKAEKQMPEKEFKKLRRDLVQKHLQTHIERQLLIHTLKSTLKDEQLKQLDKYLDSQFEEESKRIMKDLHVQSMAELDAELRKKGTTLDVLKSAFRNQRMAQQYIGLKAMPKSGFDRPDVLQYYKEHLSDYEILAQVKWQQIFISFAKHDGKKKARKVADEIIAQLDQGTSFAELAKKHSSGPTASTGGEWDWTRAGSFASQSVEDALFELPVGAHSALIENETSFEIVRVVEREAGGHKKFEAVQDDIKRQLRETQYRKAADELLKKLMETAVIETIFDGEEKKP